MTADAALSEMIKTALSCGLSIREIIREPDGTARLLTDTRDEPVVLDELGEMRKRRENRGKRHA